MNNLEQQARDTFGKANVTEFARAIEQPYFISSNAPIDGVYVRAESAIEAIQLKQQEIEKLEAEADTNKADWATVINYLDPAVLSTSSDKDRAYEVLKRVEKALANKE